MIAGERAEANGSTPPEEKDEDVDTKLAFVSIPGQSDDDDTDDDDDGEERNRGGGRSGIEGRRCCNEGEDGRFQSEVPVLPAGGLDKETGGKAGDAARMEGTGEGSGVGR